MSGFRSVANQYHAAANALAARGDRQGGLTPNQEKGIAYYRDCAAKVEALIDADAPTEVTWQLDEEARQTYTRTGVTSADKAATPQELLEKAKSK